MEDYFKNISKNIRERRLKAGISQGELAKIINRSTRFVTSLESNLKDVQVGALIDIANALECDLLDLFDGETKSGARKRVKRDVQSNLDSVRRDLAEASRMVANASKLMNQEMLRISKAEEKTSSKAKK